MNRRYIVGHYLYREMSRPATTAARAENVDSLPPTMLDCMETVYAPNARLARQTHIAVCIRSTPYQRQRAMSAKG